MHTNTKYLKKVSPKHLRAVFDEFLAIVQKIEQRDEQDFKYRQNRFKEIKFFPTMVLNALQERSGGEKVLSRDSLNIAEE